MRLLILIKFAFLDTYLYLNFYLKSLFKPFTNHIFSLFYLQRIPYENCDNLADYLSLQRAAQAQKHNQNHQHNQIQSHIQSQAPAQMSLLKFLAIVSTRCLHTPPVLPSSSLSASCLAQCAIAWPGLAWRVGCLHKFRVYEARGVALRLANKICFIIYNRGQTDSNVLPLFRAAITPFKQ